MKGNLCVWITCLIRCPGMLMSNISSTLKGLKGKRSNKGPESSTYTSQHEWGTVSRPQWHCPRNGLNVKPHLAKLQGLNPWSPAGGAVLGDSGRKLFSSRVGFEVYRLSPLPVLFLLSIFPSPFAQMGVSSHHHAALCPPKQRATGLSPLRCFIQVFYHRRRRGRRKEEGGRGRRINPVHTVQTPCEAGSWCTVGRDHGAGVNKLSFVN